MENSCAVIILAAGKGTRMGGKQAKVLIESFQGPLLHQVLSTATSLEPKQISVVVGFEREAVEESSRSWLEKSGSQIAPDLQFCEQKEQRGTGDAVKAALSSLEDFQGEVLILCGDVPLIPSDAISKLLETHREKKATVSVLTAILPEPGQYGRIIRDQETGDIQAIVEAKDASPLELLTHEVNSGVYVVDSAFLPGAIQNLETDNAQGEYYLTDIVKRAAEEGQIVCSSVTPHASDILGVNTYRDLHQVNCIQQAQIRDELALSGVTFIEPSSVVISPSAQIGCNVTIGPSTLVGEGVVIEDGVVIDGLAKISNATIKGNAHIKWGVQIDGAIVGEKSAIGPFAHLRPGTELGKEVKVGNFVETKKTTLSEGAKVSHLTYLGDATVGKDANIGAGTITCNYDGHNKFQTVIEEGAFIGSNSALVAPVTIGKGATVGAGSTITKDVEQDALGLSRAEQRSISGWSKKKRAK